MSSQRTRLFCSLVWPGIGPRPDAQRDWPEWTLIGLAVLAYASRVLDAPLALIPATATYAFHPSFALPALVADAATAMRLALLLSFLGAAVGMWWLGRVLGLGRAGRTWAALGFAFAGQAAATVAGGEIGFVLGYAWLPWAAAYAWLAVTTRRPWYVALAGLTAALIALGGHLGLIVTAAPALLFFVLGSGLARGRGRLGVSLPREVLFIGAILLALAVGLAAVGLAPALALGSALRGGVAPAAGMGAILRAYVDSSGPAVSYAYIGVAPFVLALSLLLARAKWRERPIATLALLALLSLAWAGLGLGLGVAAPMGMLAWGGLALFALAGAGLDAFWQWGRANWRVPRVYVPDIVRGAAVRGGVVVVVLLAVLALTTSYRTNQPLLGGAGAPGAASATLSGLAVLQGYAATQPLSFKAGAVVSFISFLGFLSLLITDVRRRRNRIEAEAVYSDGVLRPESTLGLPEGTPVHVTVSPAGAEEDWTEEPAAPTGEAESGVAPQEALKPAIVSPVSRPKPAPSAGGMIPAAWLLFGLALFIYLGTRLWAIDRFPIYFFADEATHAVYAQDLLDRGLKDAKGSFMPIYFEAAGNRWTPLLSVYVHAVSVALFGKSILVTRATGALVSVLAALAVALALKWVFKARFWWAGALLMAVAPAWFLHSRTGFETVMMSSFFACFLLCYLLYRTRSPRFLFAAILFGAAAFYTYSNGQMIMAAAAVLLAIFDLPYHIKNWRTVLLGLVLVAVLALPVLQFRASQPDSMNTHLRAINSYWFRDAPVSEKLAQFADRYTYGLSPAYWFIPNEHDLARHRMRGYGNLSLLLLPFFLAGVVLCLWRIRSAPHRAVLLAALATPAGAALVDVSITRVLAFTAPAAILMGIGLEAGWGLIKKRLPYGPVAALVFAALAGGSIWMARDAVVNGPLWYSDYGLYGMQYGARQLFEETIPEVLDNDPSVRIMMTSTWANGADTFIRFFLPPEQRPRVQMLNIDYYMQARRPLDANTLLVMTPAEYEQARTSPKFKSVEVERLLPYPDGRPGFYFARLAYADNLETILAQEREARSRPMVTPFELDGQIVQVSHSIFDAGQLRDLFDGDPFTLARGLEANPLVLQFDFPEPRALNGLRATFGTMDFTLTARVYGDDADEPQVYEQTFRGLPSDPTVTLAFTQGPASVSRLRLEILQLNVGNEVHIHVREIGFQ